MKSRPIIRERLNEILDIRRKESGSRDPNITTLAKDVIRYSDARVLRNQLAKGYILEEHLNKIANYLNVSPDYLAGDIELKAIRGRTNWREFDDDL